MGCGFASHGHAVVFQFLDSGDTPMVMENLVMPTYRNPGRMVMDDTAEACTHVPSRSLN